jgi:hypothetical protein
MANLPVQPTVKEQNKTQVGKDAYEQALEAGQARWNEFLPEAVELRRKMLLALVNAEVSKCKAFSAAIPFDLWVQKHPEIEPELKLPRHKVRTGADTVNGASQTVGPQAKNPDAPIVPDNTADATVIGLGNVANMIAAGSESARTEQSTALGRSMTANAQPHHVLKTSNTTRNGTRWTKSRLRNDARMKRRSTDGITKTTMQTILL